MYKAFKFTNFSKEDFSWNYDKAPFTFKAGKTVVLKEELARFFAKHLIDRELIKANKAFNVISERAKLEEKCLEDTNISSEKEEMLVMEVMNNEEVEEEVVEEEVEEEFADIKEPVVEPKKVIKKKK